MDLGEKRSKNSIGRGNVWEDFRASTFYLTSEDVHLKHFNSQGNLKMLLSHQHRE